MSDAPPMALTERDREIILAVYRHRFLRRDQIAALFFPASPEARAQTLVSSCNARLQRLFHHHYLARSIRMGYEGSSQAVYALDRRGADLVAETLGVDRAAVRWSPKQKRSELYFRDHTLAINDLWVAFELAERRDPQLHLGDWTMDGPELWDEVRDRSGPKRLPVRPDASFSTTFADRRAHFFLEVDRSTMSNRRIAEKIRAYRLYWKGGGFRDRYEASSFRVLVTAPTARRRDNLRRTAAKEGARKMFLFAVHADVVEHGPLAPVWYTVSDTRPIALTP